ncbi:Cytochrome c oxidase polypeptide III [Minicystis rosea]|nr:Cytochrome c oxidase polypeptide III [Minicystis rosea]
MREPRRLHEQFADLEKQTHAARLGMWIFLASELLLFTGLFALYTAYRALYPHDFAAAVAHNDIAIGTIMTVILITSSFTVAMSVHAVRASHPRRAAVLLAVSVAIGILFLVLKGIEYAEHFREGIFPAGAYRFAELPTYGAQMAFTLYFAMTALHGLHVVVGAGLLAGVAWGCWKKRYWSYNETPVELSGLYWHLVDIIWIFLWPLLYLTRR